MIETRTTVTLRPMRLSDISQVTVLDRLCFPTPWPASSYRFELTQSTNSSMFVLSLPESDSGPNSRSLRAWLNQLHLFPSNGSRLLGYSGFWFLVDEAHISTIGVHPDWRGHHLGELLMFAMLRESIRMGASRTTLEVRVSNSVALNLYNKYGFEIVGRRKGYYRDNREDAWMMAVNSGSPGYGNWLREVGIASFKHLDVIDEWHR